MLFHSKAEIEKHAVKPAAAAVAGPAGAGEEALPEGYLAPGSLVEIAGIKSR